MNHIQWNGGSPCARFVSSGGPCAAPGGASLVHRFNRTTTLSEPRAFASREDGALVDGGGAAAADVVAVVRQWELTPTSLYAWYASIDHI